MYVATPQLLRAFGIKASEVNPDGRHPHHAARAVRHLQDAARLRQLLQQTVRRPRHGPGNGSNSFPCPKGQCLANPAIQEVSALPSGTSAPNTVITEHAIRSSACTPARPAGSSRPRTRSPPRRSPTPGSRRPRPALTIETKNSIPTSAEIINWATVFGIVLALAILAMSVGLIRSETASDLRTLAATGASGSTRRTLTATTAGALGLLGAVLGTVAAYVAAVGFARDNSLDGLSDLSSVPVSNLLIILVGMPLIAAVVGWLLAGREPPAIAHQPIE